MSWRVIRSEEKGDATKALLKTGPHDIPALIDLRMQHGYRKGAKERCASLFCESLDHEPDSEILPSDLPAKVGQVHGGGFTGLDGALPLRLCPVDLGLGWHPLEGDW